MKQLLSLIIIIQNSTSAFAQSGITWSMGMNIAANSYDNMHPRMSLNGAGQPMVVWGKMSDKSVQFTRWNGAAFTTPIKLNPAWMTVAGASWMGPDIASKGDTVYVVVKREPEAADTNRIFIFTSYNGGVSFNAPVELAVIADSLTRFPTITTDASGNPIVAYMKFNSSFLESRWVVTKSMNYGASFMTDVKASGYSGVNAEVCDCCPGAIVTSGNKTVMLYRDNLSNIRDIWCGLSTNNSTSFPSGFAVDNNNWMVMSCPSSGPDGVIIGDTIYSTFMSSSTGTNLNYLSKSSISNAAVNTVSKLTGSIAGLNGQNFPRIANDGNAMAIVWTQNVSGSNQLPILFNKDITSGLAAKYDTVDLADVTNADVAMKNGNIFVVWQDDNSGTVKYRKGTYQVTPTMTIEINSPLFSIYPNPSNDFWQVSIPNNQYALSYTLTDINGNIVGAELITKGNSSLKIPNTNLAIGQYILTLHTHNTYYNYSIIKK
ncbi:MAG: T9SS type A sorting domain-containing protein [Bacteroidetes bacterium]|jgi:hypothetical protein|nr:T9SS type A sorting domain-containing protein [Bacteroidota bacterium]MBK6821013.1 T9SS type A sorting domain-containing protein [Bacteroidota bacterium]MBK7039197.1 T9SS type A sorting domain-containing protein [Bacteroidota bacterium]MBK7587324.1 T9SS type A sorting domain-containing protein [Bacteroidota bacterium]MBK8329163.1 T9SS type A sorting domain-containing protein [Bacteroidota bacterium]